MVTKLEPPSNPWNSQGELRATTACTFSTSQLPKVVREFAENWCVLDMLTSKRASRHNGVQLLISYLATWLRTRRFSEPTFPLFGATNHWKNTVFRDFLPFRAPASSFFWLFLFSDLLSSALLFSDSSHLCFSICPYYLFEYSLGMGQDCGAQKPFMPKRYHAGQGPCVFVFAQNTICLQKGHSGGGMGGGGVRTLVWNSNIHKMQ